MEAKVKVKIMSFLKIRRILKTLNKNHKKIIGVAVMMHYWFIVHKNLVVKWPVPGLQSDSASSPLPPSNQDLLASGCNCCGSGFKTFARVRSGIKCTSRWKYEDTYTGEYLVWTRLLNMHSPYLIVFGLASFCD